MHARLFLVACASTALLSAVACSNNRSNDQTANGTERTPPATAPNATGTSGSADDTVKAEPITLTGCLQKGDGSNYILTQVNEPSAAGAPAPKGDDSKVAREQMNAAEHAYRLKDDRNDLGTLVGKQVRVSGTLARRADLDDKVGTSGANDRDRDNDKDRVKIHEGDLAQVDVSDVQQVAAACGGHAAKGAAKSGPRRK